MLLVTMHKQNYVLYRLKPNNITEKGNTTAEILNIYIYIYIYNCIFNNCWFYSRHFLRGADVQWMTKGPSCTLSFPKMCSEIISQGICRQSFLINSFNPFNTFSPELNPICHLLALLGAHHIFHVSGLRVKVHWLLFASPCLAS